MSKAALVGPDDCNGCQMDARQGVERPHDHGCPHALRMGEYCNPCVALLISREKCRTERITAGRLCCNDFRCDRRPHPISEPCRMLISVPPPLHNPDEVRYEPELLGGADSCAICRGAIDPGAQLYVCDQCGATVCTACSENVGAKVICISCERHCDGPNCPFGCGEADRNARFVEKVRELVDDTNPAELSYYIKTWHREIYNAPCKPVKE